jgi:cytochrome c-type biogenesis protein CcmH/NrfF
LWFGPFLLLALAVWGLWRYMRQRKALVQQRMTEADTAQADSLLKD